MDKREQALTDARWRTSSYSGNGAQCVEVAVSTTTAVRDSKNPKGGELSFPRASWLSFCQSFKR
jgi:uncharacterized protein DUF397